MDAWPVSQGEALHTQTFLGHPPGCAAALASIAVIEDEKLVERAAETGRTALAHLEQQLAGCDAVAGVRGLGLMLGIELREAGDAARACTHALERGVIALPSGDDGRVIGLSPPLGIDATLLCHALDLLAEDLR
jgi:4-aminobutyrate aminotransferase-like enzyme